MFSQLTTNALNNVHAVFERCVTSVLWLENNNTTVYILQIYSSHDLERVRQRLSKSNRLLHVCIVGATSSGWVVVRENFQRWVSLVCWLRPAYGFSRLGLHRSTELARKRAQPKDTHTESERPRHRHTVTDERQSYVRMRTVKQSVRACVRAVPCPAGLRLPGDQTKTRVWSRWIV